VTCLWVAFPKKENKNNISMETSMEFNNITFLEHTTKQEYLLEGR
jgi:hypothetical protein